MRPALSRDLRYSGILDAELFAQQGTRFVEPIVFRRESHPCIDTIGGPGTRVNDGIVGQCDRMEFGGLRTQPPGSLIQYRCLDSVSPYYIVRINCIGNAGDCY
jgi:hypothetical protein